MTEPLGRLDEFPRAPLWPMPTPIERLVNLGRRLARDGLYVKRDDCNGLAFGGNKVRQLEFYLGEARSRGADVVLITGAVQSNFSRLTAAAARKLGMECHVQLEDRVPKADPLYRRSGNVLLSEMLGATLHSYPEGEDEEGADRRLAEIAGELESRGRRPYVIPLAPGHRPLGALGYVVAAREIVAQMDSDAVSFDEIVVASGSGNTHAGLLFGLRALGCASRVTGVCVRRDAAAQWDRIRSRCDEIADLLGIGSPVNDADIHLMDDFLAPGYGLANQATLGAIETAAHTEGLILDPVYSGKAMAGMLRRAGETGAASTLLFLHTGGAPAVFAYGKELSRATEGPPTRE